MGLVDLHLAPAVFWSLTLREFDALYQRLDFVRRRECDMPAAKICEVAANIHRNVEARPEPFQVGDFLLFPDSQAPTAEDPVDEPTPEAVMLKRVAAIAGILGAEITPEARAVLAAGKVAT